MDNEISLKRQKEVFGALTDPMPEEAIEWRIQRAGEKNGKVWAMVVPYADARWMMQRLDDVFGPMGWWDSYEPGPGGGVLCSLTVVVDGVEVTKQDGAPNTDIEDVKGGITDAFKRACVKWNVGDVRALYRVGDLFANVHEDGSYYQSKDREDKYPAFKWDPPSLSGNGTRPPPERKPEPAQSEVDSEKLQQLQNLYLPMQEVLKPAERRAIEEAMSGKRDPDGAIEWLTNRAAQLEADAAGIGS